MLEHLPWLASLSGLQLLGALVLIVLLSLLPSIIKSLKKKRYCEDELEAIIKTQIDIAIKQYDKKRSLQEQLIQEQMSASDKSMVYIKQTLMEEFKSYVESSRDIRAYSKILDFTLSETKNNKLKEYVRANHFLEKTNAEFTLYKKSIENTLTSYHIMLLDNEYYDEDFSITRRQLFNNNQNIMHKLKNEISRLFDELRDIAIKYSIAISKIEKGG